MRYEIKLTRACLFDLNRESSTTDVTFLKYVYLEKVKDEYRYMINIFEDNICRKVRGDETKYCGTKGSKRSVVEIVTNKTCKGRRPTAYYNKIIIDDVKKEYQEALECTNETDFRKVSARIANRYASGLRYPKGIICFLQFTFQLTRKDVQKFIAILNADYKTDIVHYDDKEILDYLSKVFEDDFKSTVIYPYIKEEIIKKREVIKDGKKAIESESQLKVDIDQLKIHVKPQYDPLIYQVAGTKEPIDAQEKVINAYEKNISEIKTLNQLKQTSDKDKLNYSLYSDADGQLIKAMGLAFQAPEKYAGMLSDKSGGLNEGFLPVPSVFVVDMKSKILFEYINPDYSTRLSASLLLAVLKNLKSTE